MRYYSCRPVPCPRQGLRHVGLAVVRSYGVIAKRRRVVKASHTRSESESLGVLPCELSFFCTDYLLVGQHLKFSKNVSGEKRSAFAKQPTLTNHGAGYLTGR